ncbi:MAG: hypothetical protein IPP39_12940 [Chitinophagaceae bacterium]|nr:hypothetical protein [Chitinophagaceae bacterium]
MTLHCWNDIGFVMQRFFEDYQFDFIVVPTELSYRVQPGISLSIGKDSGQARNDIG